MTLQASNQVVVEHATTELTGAITGNSTFASWIGWEALENGATLEEAIAISKAVEAGDFSLNDLFIAAQSKTAAGVPTDIAGEPDPTLTVNGTTFHIGHLLGETSVETWQNQTGKASTFHSREFFTSVGEDAPEGFDPNWNHVNHAPTAEAIVVNANETDSKLHGDEYVDTIVIDLLDYVKDADGDTLTVTDIALLPSYMKLTDGHIVTVDLNSDALDPLLKNELLTKGITYTVEDGHGGSVQNTLTVNITGTADQYSGTVEMEALVKTETSESGNGQQTAEPFHFDFVLPELKDGAFDFSGTVNVTVKGDFDASNENATVLSGELVDGNGAGDGLLYFVGTGNPGNNGVDKVADGYPADDVTISKSTDVAAGGFDDGHIIFDATIGGQVGTGSTIDATLTYDYWA